MIILNTINQYYNILTHISLFILRDKKKDYGPWLTNTPEGKIYILQ